ncbi:MAG TPA: cupin domain-containing protein [Thermoanaerobaculia bacterium]|jgi:mannose-6-phosphate isomerase-like protein (cupin superfamily)|nr:cupin domain-containing protein [Thermoanaerobaculia bacterium]
MSDDRFANLPIKRVPKPWGYELIFAKTERYVGKILHINRGESLSLQYHEIKEETLFVVAGELKLTIEIDGDRRELPLRAGEAFHIAPRMIHRMEAIEDTDVAEVSTPELDDVVRLEDRYGRSGTNAP